MHTAEFEEYLKVNKVKYVIDNYVPIILVPASEFNQKIVRNPTPLSEAQVAG